jgi:beta-mannanase
MNGNWYPWSGALNAGGPAGYVACWQRLHRIFQANGAHNVSWVWSVNWNSHPDTPANGYQAYYPGDAYVDWVGVSGYDLYRETPQTLYEPLYRAYAARKPMMITECGSVDRGGSTKADWVDDFAAYVRGRPAIAGVCWFDTDTHRGYPEKWRVDTDAGALAAYRRLARDPRFSA